MGCSPQTFSNVLQALQAPLMNHGALNFRIPFLFLCLLYLKYNRYNKDNYQNKQRSEKTPYFGYNPCTEGIFIRFMQHFTKQMF